MPHAGALQYMSESTLSRHVAATGGDDGEKGSTMRMRMRSSDVSMRAIGDETILLDLRKSRYLSVTGVGTRIVELLAEDVTFDELVCAIAAEYDSDRSVIESDARRFVEQLRAAGLLES
jgi:hypothetical protein